MYIDFQLLNTTVHPTEISKKTGIMPDTELGQGERNPKLNLPRQNIWSISTKVKSEEVSDHWQELKLVLAESVEEIMQLAQTGEAKFTLVINSKRVPPILIPPEMSKFAGAINASIDIDHLQQ
jgi:hypothetical protein